MVETTLSETDIEFVNSILAYDAETGIFRWRVTRGGTARAGSVAGTPLRGYIRIRVRGGFMLAHRLAWFVSTGKWPDKDIDHINGNPSDNRIINLRLCSFSENMANKKVQHNNKVGLKGASWDRKSNKWKSQISKDGKKIHLGFFYTANEAHEVYVSAAKILHGQFARAS